MVSQQGGCSLDELCCYARPSLHVRVMESLLQYDGYERHGKLIAMRGRGVLFSNFSLLHAQSFAQLLQLLLLLVQVRLLKLSIGVEVHDHQVSSCDIEP